MNITQVHAEQNTLNEEDLYTWYDACHSPTAKKQHKLNTPSNNEQKQGKNSFLQTTTHKYIHSTLIV